MQEKNEDGNRSQDGWYKHKETGAVVQLIDDPTYGVPLTNSFKKAGYVFVGTEDPRTKEVKASVEEVSKPSKK